MHDQYWFNFDTTFFDFFFFFFDVNIIGKSVKLSKIDKVLKILEGGSFTDIISNVTVLVTNSIDVNNIDQTWKYDSTGWNFKPPTYIPLLIMAAQLQIGLNSLYYIRSGKMINLETYV